MKTKTRPSHVITSADKVEKLFWYLHPNYDRHHKITDFSGHGVMYPATVQHAFKKFVIELHLDGRISKELCVSTTLWGLTS